MDIRITLVASFALVAALAACGAPVPTPNDFPPPPTGWPTAQAGRPTATPIASATPRPTPPTATPASGGAPGAATLRPPLMTLARIESVQVRILEGVPTRVQAVVRGAFPDGCTSIAGIVQGRDGNRFIITVNTKRPADAMCTMALVPFEDVVELSMQGLPRGTYTVVANSVEASFTLTQDNTVSTLPQVATPHPRVAWSDAEALILAGQASEIMQTHALEVTLWLKDGRTVVSTEPRIDAALAVIRRCGAACANTRYATE
ncbi:MAG: hypothetical protein HZB53_20080 [Chloroflexi bacterium]|nr:hypothetical protein [Chloroflexota bacterium]